MYELYVDHLNKGEEEKLYKIYVTDGIKYLLENTCHYVGYKDMIEYGTSIKYRWIDVLRGNIKDDEKDDELDGEDCGIYAADIWHRITGGRRKNELNGANDQNRR